MQFGFFNDTTNLVFTSKALSVAAGQSNSVTVQWTVPSAQPDGFIRVSLGVFNATWSLYVWQDSVAIIGVNKVVGGQAIAKTSTSTSSAAATSSSGSTSSKATTSTTSASAAATSSAAGATSASATSSAAASSSSASGATSSDAATSSNTSSDSTSDASTTGSESSTDGDGVMGDATQLKMIGALVVLLVTLSL
jgi:hypothetical protein